MVEPGTNRLHRPDRRPGRFAVPAFSYLEGILINMRHPSIRRGGRWFASLALAGIFLATGTSSRFGLPASLARAAEPSADIPGIELPGPVVAGRLGGAVYDVVYRLTVAPGHVIAASLTGAARTDFDLYLFDASASTVLSNVGLLTKSTGPTSTESISWPSRAGGTYYLDLNGATDVEGDYRLTVQTVPDPTPPTVSVVLAGGKAITNDLTIPVTLTAADDLSGVTEMALSGDGVNYAPWQVFQRSTTWTFTLGDGPRMVWAKVKNGVGLESLPVTASVTIDTVAPEAIEIEPSPGSRVAGLRPRFTVVFSEPMDPTTWIDLGLIVQSASGALIAGSYTYDEVTRTGSFVPSSPLQAGASYIVTVANVRDIAGNRVTSPGSWSIVPLAVPTLEVTATPKVVVFGGSARLDVNLTGGPLPAALEVSSAPRATSVYAPFTTLAVVDGRQALVVQPQQNTTYRFRYEGTASVAPAQLDVPVLVRRSVVLAGRNSTVVSSAKVGASVRLTAAISPAAAGVSVSFRLYRFDAARRVWVYAGSRGRSTDAAGRASYTWVPAAAGSWYVRAAVASTAEFANNVSPVYRWFVRR